MAGRQGGDFGRIGGYRIERRMQSGSGGQGYVVEALCEEKRYPFSKPGTRVALKIMHAPQDETAESKWRKLKKRTDELCAIDHPNVVKYLGCFRDSSRDVEYGEEVFVVVQELLAGETMKDRLKRSPNGLDADEAVRIVKAACEGLAYTSSRGIVHRDVKPGNIFLCLGGDGARIESVKVIDFEIAKQQDAAQTATATTTTGFKGTLDYMAPDFRDSLFGGDESSDVYSMGVVFHEALTGRAPYKKRDGAAGTAMFPWASAMDGGNALNISGRTDYLLCGAKRLLESVLEADREKRLPGFARFAKELGALVPSAVCGGRYTLLQLVGRGGFGVVYKAVDAKGRLVAVKQPRSRDFDRKRFEREAKAGEIFSGKGFPVFVEKYEGESGRHTALVTEYLPGMPGMSLRDAIKSARDNEEQLDRSAVLVAFARYARGLSGMHTHPQRFIHRDIKPSNLYFDPENPDKAVIFDFGIVKEIEGTLTRGGIPGTPDYMPPEAFLEGARGDEGGDIYALGLSLYEALTLKRAYPPLPTGDGCLKAAQERARGKEKPSLEGLDGALLELVQGMTDPNPRKRIRDAGAVAARLEELARSDLTVAGRGVDWRRVFAVAAFCVCILAAVGACVWAISGNLRKKEPEPQPDRPVPAVQPPESAKPPDTPEPPKIPESSKTLEKPDLPGPAPDQPQESPPPDTPETPKAPEKPATPVVPEKPGKPKTPKPEPAMPVNLAPQPLAPDPKPKPELAPVPKPPEPPKPAEKGFARVPELPAEVKCFIDGNPVASGQSIELSAGLHEYRYENTKEFTYKDKTVRIYKRPAPENFRVEGGKEYEIPANGEWYESNEFNALEKRKRNDERAAEEEARRKREEEARKRAEEERVKRMRGMLDGELQAAFQFSPVYNRRKRLETVKESVKAADAAVMPDEEKSATLEHIDELLAMKAGEIRNACSADVTVDGRTIPVGETKLFVYSNAVPEVWTAVKPGCEPYTLERKFDGETVLLVDAKFTLSPVEVRLPDGTGNDVECKVDGKKWTVGLKLRPGIYAYEYTRAGYEPSKGIFEVEQGTVAEVPEPVWNQLKILLDPPKLESGIVCLLDGTEFNGVREIQPGRRHTVEYSKRGYVAISRNLDVKDVGESPDLRVPAAGEWKETKEMAELREFEEQAKSASVDVETLENLAERLKGIDQARLTDGADKNRRNLQKRVDDMMAAEKRAQSLKKLRQEAEDAYFDLDILNSPGKAAATIDIFIKYFKALEEAGEDVDPGLSAGAIEICEKAAERWEELKRDAVKKENAGKMPRYWSKDCDDSIKKLDGLKKELKKFVKESGSGNDRSGNGEEAV